MQQNRTHPPFAPPATSLLTPHISKNRCRSTTSTSAWPCPILPSVIGCASATIERWRSTKRRWPHFRRRLNRTTHVPGKSTAILGRATTGLRNASECLRLHRQALQRRRQHLNPCDPAIGMAMFSVAAAYAASSLRFGLRAGNA